MDKREELETILFDVSELEISVDEAASRIEALYAPRPFSLDPNSENYKVPEVGQAIDIFNPESGIVINREIWLDMTFLDLSHCFWLPSRAASDFNQ